MRDRVAPTGNGGTQVRICSNRWSWIAGAALAILPLVATAQELVVGMLGSLKNPLVASSTKQLDLGTTVYFQDLNSRGGIGGRKVRVVFRDDEFTGDGAIKAAAELLDEQKAVVLLNTVGGAGPTAFGKAGSLTERNAAVVGTFTGNPTVHAVQNVFPVRANYKQEYASIVRQMLNMGIQRVGVLYFNVALGPPSARLMSEPDADPDGIVKAGRVTWIGSEGYDVSPDPAVQAANIKAAVTRLGKAKPQAVVLFAVGSSVPVALRAIHSELGPQIVRISMSVNSVQEISRDLGEDEARGIVFSQAIPYPQDSNRRIVREYLAAMKKFAPSEAPSYQSLEGFMNAKVAAEAMRRARPTINSATVVKALSTLGRFDLGDLVVNFSPERKIVETNSDVVILGPKGRLVR